MQTTDAAQWFAKWSGGAAPYDWQAALLSDAGCRNQVVRIPTGFGKTLGVVGAWAWHRLVRRDDAWPRRLVFCLPMRVLVEQTVAVLEEALSRVGLGAGSADGVRVHCLMGGVDATDWHLHADRNAVLVGTQDMLLSRALNRGYAAARARWPMEFGLLHQDALWVFDEVQLMDVGLATSVQLEAFRSAAAANGQHLRPTATWWMSATLQRSWLRTADTELLLTRAPTVAIPPSARTGGLWTGVSKPVRVAVLRHEAKAAGRAVAEQVVASFATQGRGKLTLVVLNTVERAVATHAALAGAWKSAAEAPDLRLVHSRFRPAERKTWRSTFLHRNTVLPAAGRIIVATQVVEAGVDLDAHLLVTELAPWPSLVQRFGRAARGGGCADVTVIDFQFDDDSKAAPYACDELDAARVALSSVADVAPLYLEAYEEGLTPAQLGQLYPYKPKHLLLQRDIEDLFDTTPDLTGADLDISRYIRSGPERDCNVAWVSVAGDDTPASTVQPARDALCSVPFLKARDWLCRAGRAERLAPGVRAWVWDYLEGTWRLARRSTIAPGTTLLVAADCGGYTAERGWDPGALGTVAPVPALTAPAPQDIADAAQDTEALSEAAYKTIGAHGREVAEQARELAQALGIQGPYARALTLAGRWHDLGKAHPAFQGSIRPAAGARPQREDIAKAPSSAFSPNHLYVYSDGSDRRPGFRHELASALALFEVLRQRQPAHPALLGGLEAWFALPAPAEALPPPTAAEREILALDAEAFALVAYLVASHHGKVRMSLHAEPRDQAYRDRDGRGLPVRGVREGDRLPAVALEPDDGPLPALTLTLEPAAMGLSAKTGRSWAERTHGLLRREGPFVLAYLEACLRTADVRASQLTTADPLLEREVSP